MCAMCPHYAGTGRSVQLVKTEQRKLNPNMEENTNAIIVRAKIYQSRCEKLGRAHHIQSEYLKKWNQRLVVPAIVLSAIVGTTLFVTIILSKDYIWLKVLLGMFSLASAVLATIESRLGFSDTSEKYRYAGSKYRAFARKFDFFILKFSHNMEDEKSRENALSYFKELIEKLEELALESPNIKSSIYKKAKLEIEGNIRKNLT